MPYACNRIDNDSPGPVVAASGYESLLAREGPTAVLFGAPVEIPAKGSNRYFLIGTSTAIHELYYDENTREVRIYANTWVGVKQEEELLYRGPKASSSEYIIFELEVDVRWNIGISLD